MNTLLYYFTGTGNTLDIANYFSKNLDNTKLIPITPCLLSNFSKEEYDAADTVGIFYPTYFYDAPKIIYDFLKLLPQKATPYLFLHGNCGGGIGNALSFPYKALKERGILVNSTHFCFLPDNSVIFPTPNSKYDEMFTTASLEMKKQLEVIKNKTTLTPPARKYASKLLGKAMYSYAINHLGFDQIKVKEERCVQCGLCEKVCSMKNIDTKKGIPSIGNNCSMCFSCIHYCPKMALHYKKMKKTDHFQYRNPNISLETIQDSRK